MISNSDLYILLLIDFTDIMMTEDITNFNCNFLNYYNTIDYNVALDLCIGYQYLSLCCIQISPIVASHTMHSFIFQV